MDRAGALPSTSATTAGSAAGSPSSAGIQGEEEGSWLLENVTAAEDSTEHGAGDPAEVAPVRKKRKKSKTKRNASISGEENSLPPQSTAPVQTTELPDTSGVPQEIPPEIQTPGAEGAKPGADGLPEATADSPEHNRDVAHLGKEGGSQKAEGLSPAEQSSTASGAGPGHKNANTKEKNQTPREKMPKVSERTSPSQGAEAARKEGAVAAADSPKNKKEQKNQKPVEKIKESSVSRNGGVTVYFHAILSKDFQLNPDTHKVFIRAQDIPPYANWKDNICELNCTRHLGEHGYLIEGAVTLTKEIVDKYIPYKYWVTCGKGAYEFIYKTPQSNHVNRCLLIKKTLLNNGEWHQYDDIVCAKPSRFKNVLQILTRDKNKEVVEGKKIAANVMLESIFSILGSWSPDNLRNFFWQLKQFHYVAVAQRVFDGKAMSWIELNFSTEQVNDLLLKHMKKMAVPFLAAEAAPEGRAMQSRLALGLTILTVVEDRSLPALKADLADLCSLLCLDQDAQDEIQDIKQAFAGVTNLKVDLTNLCQRCIERDVDQWVWILPLLHSFGAPLQQEHELLEEDVWAGLEGLPFAETRRKRDKATLLERMREKKFLMEFDGTLVKSWLSVLPLGNLPEFIKDFCSDLLVTLQGVLYRLEDTDILWGNAEVVEKLLNTVLCALDEPPGRALGARSWQCCLSCCLRLHEKLCKATRKVDLFLIPATAAILIAKVAQLRPPAVPGDAVQELAELLSGALRDTRTWFRNALKQKLLKEYLDHVTFSFYSELRAWNKFVTLSFPDEQFTQTWRSTLLADLKRRIQQVRESPGFAWCPRAAGVTWAVLGAGARANTVALAITIAIACEAGSGGSTMAMTVAHAADSLALAWHRSWCFRGNPCSEQLS
uniref:Ring finger protein 213 n=1 Tax=Cyanistes caeruleus TaxID=156563 RepID=A0A8C0VAY7_CYACU